MLTIKKQSEDYTSIKIGSDFHYGHDKDFLTNPRGFKNGTDHAKWIEEQILGLDPNDLLIFLGDFGLSIGASPIVELLNRIPCETLMVWGNHNSGIMQAYKSNLPKGFENCEIYPLRIAKNVTMLGGEFLLNIDRHRFFCRHMAPLIWEDINKGRCALVGHSHGNCAGIQPDSTQFGKILDCGVENTIAKNGTAFFDLNEVVEIMAKKEISRFDHH